MPFISRRFERGGDGYRAWWGALEKPFCNERHNLQLPQSRRGSSFYPPPVPPILEISE